MTGSQSVDLIYLGARGADIIVTFYVEHEVISTRIYKYTNTNPIPKKH